MSNNKIHISRKDIKRESSFSYIEHTNKEDAVLNSQIKSAMRKIKHYGFNKEEEIRVNCGKFSFIFEEIKGRIEIKAIREDKIIPYSSFTGSTTFDIEDNRAFINFGNVSYPNSELKGGDQKWIRKQKRSY